MSKKLLRQIKDEIADLNFNYNQFNGLNITFINMPLRETAQPNTPPEGPGILAAIARKYGATPHIIDLNAYRIRAIKM